MPYLFLSPNLLMRCVLSNRNLLLSLHYLLPRPWNKLEVLYSHLTNETPFSHEFPNSFHTDWPKIKDIDFESYYRVKGIVPITILDENYPESLKHIFDPPSVLYTRGNSDLLKTNQLAIIGSRKASTYSAQCIDLIAPVIKDYQYTICSGMARGADAMAHLTAMQHDIPTIAILGSGFDHVYPREHQPLFDVLSRDHLVLSEYPPTTTPKPHQFVARNRIISGLSKAVIVTEAALKSGTMSTVDFALEEGKELLTFPGSVFSELSKGPNQLIQQGAFVVTDEQIFRDFLQSL